MVRRSGNRTGRRRQSGRQLRLPLQISAHRILIAGVPVMVPEQVVDTLLIGRVARGSGHRQAGSRPASCAAAHDPQLRRGQLGEVDRGDLRQRLVLGEQNQAADFSTGAGSRSSRGRMLQTAPSGCACRYSELVSSETAAAPSASRRVASAGSMTGAAERTPEAGPPPVSISTPPSRGRGSGHPNPSVSANGRS